MSANSCGMAVSTEPSGPYTMWGYYLHIADLHCRRSGILCIPKDIFLALDDNIIQEIQVLYQVLDISRGCPAQEHVWTIETYRCIWHTCSGIMRCSVLLVHGAYCLKSVVRSAHLNSSISHSVALPCCIKCYVWRCRVRWNISASPGPGPVK